jgi:5-formyltetrahydrofolate cyclo-ligase
MTELPDKPALRRMASSLRAAARASLPESGLAIARNFAASVPATARMSVAGYIATRDEIDPAPLMDALRETGHVIALPRVVGKEQPLRFHRWDTGAVPVAGSYGLLEPAPDWPELLPDLVLVPLLAFDAFGYRLGYGGGYYDRTLRQLRARGPVLAVGLGFAVQEMAELPHDAGDERLDWIVTEEEGRRFDA